MRRLILCLAVVLVLVGVGQASATIHTFDFDSGLGPNFSTFSEGSLWTVDTRGPNLRISKPADDGTYNMNGQIVGGAVSNFRVHGDFTATVDFALHDFPDSGADHKINLSLLAVIPESSYFGPFNIQSLFEVLRVGRSPINEIEVFTYLPAAAALGVTELDLYSGRYRISRSGTTVTGSYAIANSSEFSTIASVDYSLESMLIELYAGQGGEGGPRSHTSLDISFDNLIIEADDITGIVPEPSTLAIWSLLTLCGFGWHRRRKA